MADSYKNAGRSLHQAVEIYFSLIREHEETPQADEAVERILEIATGTRHRASRGRPRRLRTAALTRG